MILKGSLSYINEFFFIIINKIRKVYLRSKLYNKKISIIETAIYNLENYLILKSVIF